MNSLIDDKEEPAGGDAARPKSHVLPILDEPVVSILDDSSATTEAEPYILSEAEPLSIAETVRKSGLAWSAAIALFGAVIAMLLIGWGADLLFGSSPWGIVIGILIGAAIGFFQFFRITGEILKK